MVDSQEISETQLICLHEASHAVLAFLLGFQITSIEINRDEKNGICCRDFRSSRQSIIPELRDVPELEKHVMVCCAGYASMNIIKNSNQCWDYSADYANAVRVLEPKYDKRIIGTYIESVLSWAIEILQENWSAVEMLTDRLMWYAEKNRFEDYPGNDFEDLLPPDYFEEPESWEMSGEEAEQIIERALVGY
jgi:hypothetical protein